MATTRGYTTEEIRALTEAGVTLTSELSLPALLQKLVDIARAQVNARYGAMSVLGPDGDIREFLSSGISQEERDRIGRIPRGEGLLGVLLREGASLRLDDMSTDPRYRGFPANHPPMKSLLGVPVISRGRIVGNLYLSDKQGAKTFDERDEEILRLLATQAAVAIHNAELYEAEQRRSEEWKTLFELGREITASPSVEDLLSWVVTRARSLLNTDIAVAYLLTLDRENLSVAAEVGLRGDKARGPRPIEQHALQALVVESVAPLIVENLKTDPRTKDAHSVLAEEEGIVSAIAVPLTSGEGPLGIISVGNRRASLFGDREVELLEAFANLASVAIETRKLQEKLESLARLEERERIGMDLHDGVIQSIYAVGLHLEDAADRLPGSPQEVKADLERAMDDLNRVIKEIRGYIFDLRPRVSSVEDLPEAIRQLVENLRVNTLIDAQLEITGGFPGVRKESEALALFHIVQEALNNVAKHSRASRAVVRLRSERDVAVLEIEDNGVGFDPTEGDFSEKHGIRNIKDRARSVGAHVAYGSMPGEGTRVKVELPLNNRKGD